jgi:hypothetical protein
MFLEKTFLVFFCLHVPEYTLVSVGMQEAFEWE